MALTYTPAGLFNCAAVACPLSPLKPATPVPAMVEITPAVVMRRTRCPSRSAINISPAVLTATAIGKLSCALVACPLSPLEPATPVPAMVKITPAWVTLRTRL